MLRAGCQKGQRGRQARPAALCPPPLAATARFVPTHGLSAAVASRARDWRSIPGSVLRSCAQRGLKILLLSCSGQPGLAGISPFQAPAFRLGLIDASPFTSEPSPLTKGAACPSEASAGR